jgi:hypothetical protein
MTDKISIRRLLATKIMEASTTLARFTEDEFEIQLAIKQLADIHKYLEESLETFGDEEKAMYEDKIASFDEHPADRVDRMINNTSDEEVNQKIQKSRVIFLNTIGEFIDPFTIKRNIFKD